MLITQGGKLIAGWGKYADSGTSILRWQLDFASPIEVPIKGSDGPPRSLFFVEDKAGLLEAGPDLFRAPFTITRGPHVIAALVPAGGKASIQLVDSFPLSQPMRLRLRLSRLPPSSARLRASLDASDGSHTDLEWDPAQPAGLTRTATLSGNAAKPPTWRISFSADPIFVQTDATGGKSHYVTLSLTPSLTVSGNDVSGEAAGDFVDAFDRRSLDERAFPPISVDIQTLQLPKLADLRSSFTQPRGTEPGRSLQDAVPPGVGELFQILAEIAVDRARAKAFEVVSATVVKFVCDLKMPRNEILAASGLPPVDGDEPQLLPNTCLTVQHVRIQDLATSAKNVLNALFSDAAEFGVAMGTQMFRALLKNSALVGDWAPLIQPLMDQITPLVIDLAHGRIQQLGGREAHMILARLAAVDWFALIPKTIGDTQAMKAIACGLNVGFAVVGYCHAAGQCDARQIADLIDHADQHFNKDPADPSDACIDVATVPPGHVTSELRNVWPDIDQFISRVIDLISTAKNGSARTALRTAINLTFDVIGRILRLDQQGIKETQQQLIQERDALTDLILLPAVVPPNSFFARVRDLAQQRTASIQERLDTARYTTAIKGADAESTRLAELVRDIQRIVNGVLDQDVQPVLLGAADLVALLLKDFSTRTSGEKSALNGKLQKLTMMAAALASYAATFVDDSAKDAKSLEVQHEARKKAVESFIDAATARTNRDGNWIVSVGANVGFSSGGQALARYGYHLDGAGAPQLELNTGLALQWLPDRHRPNRFLRYWGLHFQVILIDLGQFLAYDKSNHISTVTWGNFITVGGQVGFLIGTAANPVAFGFEGRWSPTLFAGTPFDLPNGREVGGSYRIGAFVTYYVPFLDFN